MTNGDADTSWPLLQIPVDGSELLPHFKAEEHRR
jgi:hypothetical protein